MTLPLSALLASRAPATTVPQSFVEFTEWLDVELRPGQRVLCLVAFDGWEPRDFKGADRELCRRMMGDVDVIPKSARTVIVAVCGARGGKSYILGALRILHQALVRPIPTLAPGERAVGLIVAPKLKLAAHTLRYIEGAIDTKPELQGMVVGKAVDSIILQRSEGRVSIETLAASAGGDAVRGRSLLAALMDESAFFGGEEKVVNDAEIFKAITPRLVTGAQAAVVSTPWAEMGLLYEMFTRNHEAPQTAMAFHAPTTLLRDDAETASWVARERETDPDNASREYDAEFMSVGSVLFFDGRAITAAIDRSLEIPAIPAEGTEVEAAGDFGFRTNSSALVATQVDSANVHTVIDVHERRPTAGPLKPSEVCKDFAERMRQAGTDTLHADAHYQESVTEHLEAESLYFAITPAGNEGKALMFTVAKNIMNESRLRLPNESRLIKQLRQVTKRPLSGGGIRIDSPTWSSGAHGDIASALVAAVYAASKHEVEEPKPKHEPNTAEWHEQRERERKQRAIDKFEEEQNDDGLLGDSEWIQRGAEVGYR